MIKFKTTYEHTKRSTRTKIQPKMNFSFDNNRDYRQRVHVGCMRISPQLSNTRSFFHLRLNITEGNNNILRIHHRLSSIETVDIISIIVNSNIIRILRTELFINK